MKSAERIQRIGASSNVTEVVRTCAESDRPVIIEGACKAWPAFSKWSHEYLGQTVGYTPVLYRMSRSNRHPDLRNEDLSLLNPVSGSMKAFLDLIGPENELDERSKYYLTGDGRTMGFSYDSRLRTALGPLLDDIVFPEYPAREDIRTVGLWVGAKGTQSWLHYDSQGLSNLNMQITGTKEVVLYAPSELSNMYMYSFADRGFGQFSRIDIECPDFNLFPRFESAQALTGTLCAGDCLFLPPFWFHSLRGTGDFNTNINIWWSSQLIRMSTTALRSAAMYYLSQMKTTQSEERNQDCATGESRVEVTSYFKQLEQLICSSENVHYI